MPPNLRFIPHTAQRHTHKLTSQSPSNRATQRGFSDTGGPYKAKNLTASVLLARKLPHSQKLKNTLFHFIQSIMILVENVTRLFQIQAIFGLFVPRQCHKPIDVGPHNRRLSGHGGHFGKAIQLMQGLLFHFFRHPSLENLLSQFSRLRAAVPVPQLLLNGAELFLQIVLTVAAVNFLAHSIVDTMLHLQQFVLSHKKAHQQLQPLLRCEHFEQFLPLRNTHMHMRGDQIRQ